MFTLFYVTFFLSECVYALFGTSSTEYVCVVYIIFSQANVFTLFLVPPRANVFALFYVIFLGQLCLRYFMVLSLADMFMLFLAPYNMSTLL